MKQPGLTISEADPDPPLPIALLKTLHHFAPDFLPALSRIPEQCGHQLRVLLVRALIRGRCLERWRILGCYAIAIDGTGMIVYHQRHCPHCLTRKVGDGSVEYYHPVLEAKLVLPGLGMALSIGTEFIENPGKFKNDKDKQDCELKAFRRLLPRLRKDFPQMAMCQGGLDSQDRRKLDSREEAPTGNTDSAKSADSGRLRGGGLLCLRTAQPFGQFGGA